MAVREGLDQYGVAQLWDDDARVFTDLRADPVLVRPYTAAENATADALAAAAAQAATEKTLREMAATALQSNRDFLALATLTNADVVAQVKALTRQNNGLIRLVLHRLDGTE